MKWDRQHMQRPGRPVPKLSTKPAAYVAGHQYRPAHVPVKDQAAYWELTARFRAGELYAFTWEPKSKTWLTWRTEADWLATERNGQVRRPELAAAGHGPTVWSPAPAAKPVKSTRAPKQELVSMLRRVLDGTDWEVAELEDLLARA